VILDILTRSAHTNRSSTSRWNPNDRAATYRNEVTGPEKDAAFIRALLSDIHSRLDTKLDGYWDSSNYKDVLISVIVKSAGLPEIRICDPWPTCDYDVAAIKS
jgi:hypothetical protein